MLSKEWNVGEHNLNQHTYSILSFLPAFRFSQILQKENFSGWLENVSTGRLVVQPSCDSNQAKWPAELHTSRIGRSWHGFMQL